jgi:16S rRNA (guanine527-N7)-methyltransferase
VDDFDAQRDTLRKTLQAGLATLGLPCDAARVEKLLDYLALLVRWNRTYNLTAVREPVEMVTRHLLDSLTLLPWLTPGTLVDLGTGPGLPGIPIAIMNPEREVVLVESNGKKARFLREALRQLGLSAAQVVEGRAEAGGARAPQVTARALAELGTLAGLALPWLAEGGKLLAMKGPGHAGEVHSLPPGWRVEAVHALHVPGLDAERALVIVTHS